MSKHHTIKCNICKKEFTFNEAHKDITQYQETNLPGSAVYGEWHFCKVCNDKVRKDITKLKEEHNA
jgi:hypothetical protein